LTAKTQSPPTAGLLQFFTSKKVDPK